MVGIGPATNGREVVVGQTITGSQLIVERDIGSVEIGVAGAMFVFGPC
jgi:hypothetical protein